jgi:hypothetical protein
MTMPTDLFRREALDYWTRQHGPGSLLRAGARWVGWLYWTVLALVAVGLALIFLVRIGQTTTGPALVDPQQETFVAALPAAAGSDLQQGHPLRLEVDTPTGARSVAATVQHVDAAEDADVERAGFSSFPSPAVIVRGVLAPGTTDPPRASTSPRMLGRAVVALGSQQAFSVFVRGFDGAPEGSG